MNRVLEMRQSVPNLIYLLNNINEEMNEKCPDLTIVSVKINHFKHCLFGIKRAQVVRT